MSPAAAVSVRGVSKRYRPAGRRRAVGSLKSALVSRGGSTASLSGVPALTGVSFEVAPGETVGIVGANGSGKSTLLKLLAGIIRPSEGVVVVQGRLAALLELGAGFHPELTGRENVEIAGLLLGLSRKEVAARFDAIVRFAELEQFLDAPLRTYSSGMAVRLGFSIAAHSDPDVLLVDEVLAVGDEAFAHRSLEKFSEFEKARKTILLVSHDLSLVAERCRRAIWLDGGRIAADGPGRETVARYREAVAQAEGEKRLDRAVSDRPSPGSPGSIGSGRARISGARVLDATGLPAGRLRSGEPASLEMDVRASETLTDFVFGFAISTVAGSVVFGSNTEIEGRRPLDFSGEGSVRLEIPAFALAPGIYSLDAAVHARDGAPYDYRRDLLRFEVTADAATAGVWSPERRWSFEGPIRWKP
ncbi:MAG: ABC transporter ATP-binding protein [Acidobacteriota bacterium]|nr:ABC transporter ATP-binding protein [Acidobacteriota bacterium]